MVSNTRPPARVGPAFHLMRPLNLSYLKLQNVIRYSVEELFKIMQLQTFFIMERKSPKTFALPGQ
jgi:hypothetical protein